MEQQAKCLWLNTNPSYSAHLLVVLGADRELTKQLQVLRVVWLQLVIDVLIGVAIIRGPARIDVRSAV